MRIRLRYVLLLGTVLIACVPTIFFLKEYGSVKEVDEKLERLKKYYESPEVIALMLSESSWGAYEWHTRFKIEISPGVRIDETEYLIKDHRISDKTRILDWGCGMGWFATYLAKKYRCKVDGINISKKQLFYANELAQKEGVKHLVRFDLYEGKSLPYKEASYDMVYSQEAICNAPDKKAVYKEIYRVLKPGGVLAAQDWYGNENNRDWRLLVRPIDMEYKTTVESIQGSARISREVGFENIKTVDARDLIGEEIVKLLWNPFFEEAVRKHAFTIGFLFARKPKNKIN